MLRFTSVISLLVLCLFCWGQVASAPARSEGEGPFTQLIIRGATLINGNGAPPIGPVDIVIEQNKIVSVRTVGFPGVTIDPESRPKLKEDGKEIDAEGMFVLPGFVDMHGHIGGSSQGTSAEYVFKLWLAHGVTTILEPGSFNGLDWVLDHKTKSQNNAITAPRIVAYTGFGMNLEEAPTIRAIPGEKNVNKEHLNGTISTVAQAKSWVQANYRRGSDGIKFFGASPEVMEAAIK